MKFFHLSFGSSPRTYKYPVIDKQLCGFNSMTSFDSLDKERQTIYVIGCFRLYFLTLSRWAVKVWPVQENGDSPFTSHFCHVRVSKEGGRFFYSDFLHIQSELKQMFSELEYIVKKSPMMRTGQSLCLQKMYCMSDIRPGQDRKTLLYYRQFCSFQIKVVAIQNMETFQG